MRKSENRHQEKTHREVKNNFIIFSLNQDKTFGLKNKKGAKTQKFIAQVEKQVKSGGQHNLLSKDKDDKKAEKERKLKVKIFNKKLQLTKFRNNSGTKRTRGPLQACHRAKNRCRNRS